MSAMRAEQSAPVRPVTGREIAARRKRIGLRQKDLAEQAEVSRDTISDWERGTRRPQVQTVEAVVAALDRLEEEMGIDSPPPASSASVVEFHLPIGPKGADVVVKGPIGDMDALEASVARLLARLAEEGGDGESTPVD